MRLSFLVFFLSVNALALTSKEANAVFGERQGCFILQDIESGKIVFESDSKICGERWYACSTFKIPLAVMGLDSGVIGKDSNFKWDGKSKLLKAWEKDQTVDSWLKDSVVWVSQEMTLKIGQDKIKSYLKNFKYGNQDFSGGLTKAWLSSTLKISANEQVEFLRRLKNRAFNIKPEIVETVLSAMPVESSSSKNKIYGKTGSGFSWSDDRSTDEPYRVGWYIGYFEKGKKHYAFATVFKDKTEKGKQAFGGPEAKEISINLLNKF